MASEAARRRFAPEFMNRIDKMVVFHPLRREQLERILEIELTMIQQRLLETPRGHFVFRATQAAKDFLLREGTDLKYGARHLKRAIERHLVYPLDRKSTRLNSSHGYISYAVFCLKKKK